MAILHSLRAGELGTPKHTEFLNALVQVADVISGAATPLEVVAVPATGVFLYGEANAAAQGDMKRTIHFELRNAAGEVQTWFNGQGTITPTETCNDAQIGIPVITGGNTIDFVDGVATVEFVLDTDEGSTETYANADFVTITCAVANIMGVAVTATAGAHVLTAEQVALLFALPKTKAPTAVQANAAGATSMKRHVVLQLRDSDGNILTWAAATVTLTPTETCNDAQIGIPVVVGGNAVAIVAGVGQYDFAYATDANVTKHYIPTDFVTITPACTAVGGEAVTITEGIVVDTFV